MNSSLEAVLIGCAVFVVLLLLWRFTRKAPATPPPFQGNAMDELAPIPPLVVENFEPRADNFEAEVRMLIDYGNKPGAVRLVREKLGLDLKDAKDLVDKMEQGAPVPIDAPASLASSTTPTSDSDNVARRLARDGRLIEAIKLVREQKGLDLKQAKEYVERL